MTKKIDQRLPKDSGATKLPNYAAIKSPWERMYGFRDAMRYITRYEAVFGAAILQGIRILIPEYEDRAQTICQAAFDRMDLLPLCGLMLLPDHLLHIEHDPKSGKYDH